MDEPEDLGDQRSVSWIALKQHQLRRSFFQMLVCLDDKVAE
jgi:hypothetical protein